MRHPYRFLRIIGTVSVLTGLLIGSAVTFGASTVTFELGIDGSNNGASCPFTAPQPMFTGHDPSDGRIYVCCYEEITWSVKVSATGTHTVNGTEYPIRGVANFVFDLELHENTADGPLVNVEYFSYANFGPGYCPSKSAEFAFTMDPFSTGPARVIDPQPDTMLGGPGLDFFMYPTDMKDGRLLGMGAGYSQWVRLGGLGSSIAGLGQEIGQPGDPIYGVLGRGPICEGQILYSMTGTFVLKLIPKSGNNVLRGDKDLSVSQSAFAVAADTVVGDQITFTIVPDMMCNTPRMDDNGDLHVDAIDFDAFSACYNGPTNKVTDFSCMCKDANGDQYVDAIDFDAFSACYNGPVNPPGCAE